MASSIDIVVVSDLHVNSKFGLWPPNYVDRFGNGYVLNKGQRYLFGKWINGIENLPDPIHVLIFNGDLRDGKAPADKGWAQMTPNELVPQDACLSITKPLRDKAKIIYVTEGSRYHESVEQAESLAEWMDAKPSETGLYCWPNLSGVKIGSTYLDARHKLGNPRKYTATALQDELRKARIAAKRKGYIPSVQVGGHWHLYILTEDAEGVAVTAPGWELLNRYAMTREPDLWMPDIGFLHIRIYPERHRWGRRAWDIQRILYPHPRRGTENVLDILEILEREARDGAS